ncbi:hypothetical protein JTB14_022792 [Gonioctena quinquepunctata]|nr:hypothetical protein JTB14_022792 [Gonioctena quinquepunctata]
MSKREKIVTGYILYGKDMILKALMKKVGNMKTRLKKKTDKKKTGNKRIPPLPPWGTIMMEAMHADVNPTVAKIPVPATWDGCSHQRYAAAVSHTQIKVIFIPKPGKSNHQHFETDIRDEVLRLGPLSDSQYAYEWQGKNRRIIKTVVRLLKEHCQLNKHLSLIGITGDPEYGCCLENEETATYIIKECLAVAVIRESDFEDVFSNPDVISYKKTASSTRNIVLIKRPTCK